MTASTMKAIRVHAFGGLDALQLDDVPRPTAGPGELLIRLHATSINPLERLLRAGAMQAFMPVELPFTPGSDLAGVVEAVGAGVSGFNVGQSVFGCVPPTRGGGYAEFIAAPADVIVAKPATIDFAAAASVPSVAMTAWQALFQVAGLSEGQSVLVHGGAGGVGLFAVQLAKWKGARVTATASAKNLDFVRSLGAETVIDHRADRFEEHARGMDVVLDAIGGETQQRSWQTLKPGGILVALPAPPDAEAAARHGVRAAMVQMQGDRQQLAKIAELLERGELRTFVGATFPLAEAAAAQQANERGQGRGKTVLLIA